MNKRLWSVSWIRHWDRLIKMQFIKIIYFGWRWLASWLGSSSHSSVTITDLQQDAQWALQLRSTRNECHHKNQSVNQRPVTHHAVLYYLRPEMSLWTKTRVYRKGSSQFLPDEVHYSGRALFFRLPLIRIFGIICLGRDHDVITLSSGDLCIDSRL